MMEERVSDFSFLGKRDYIQGPVLLAFALESLWHRVPDEGEIAVQLFKINRPVARNVVLARECRDASVKAAEIRFKTSQGADSAVLKCVGGPIAAREGDPPSIVKDIETDGSYSGSGCVQAADFMDVLKGIVEVNKQIHLAGDRTDQARPRIRVVYFERFKAFQSIISQDVPVVIENTLMRNYKDSCYSLSTVSYELRNQMNPMKICFSYNTGQKT